MNQAIDIIADEFLRGQRDCQKGIPHKSGQSESYDRGYGAQYEKEQRDTELTKNHQGETYGY